MFRETHIQSPISNDRTEGSSESGDNGNGRVITPHHSTDVVCDADVAENIFRTQRDVSDFILICAKHLASENQDLSAQIEDRLKAGEVVTYEAGMNIPRLTADVYRVITDAIPNLRRSTIDEVIQGIVKQFKFVEGLENGTVK
jgi:hypothetical protein